MLTLAAQANPRLARTKDDDDRLPIHWAVSYNRFPVVELLVSQKSFDPDVEVATIPSPRDYLWNECLRIGQDGSGWTPLMIAASLRDAEGDPIIEQLLQKEADVNVKSTSGQVHPIYISLITISNKQPRTLSTSQPPKSTSQPSASSSPTNAAPE